MLARYPTHLLLGLLALACAQTWNRLNLQAMLEAPYARYNVRGERVLTATDDASYLQAVDRWLGDRPDLQGPQHARPDLRAPGYRLWYLLPRLVLDPLPAQSVLVWLQCLLYSASVALLWEVLLFHGMVVWLRWSIALLFAVMPTFHGFLFHTLSEGVTPALSLSVLGCAMLAPRSRTWLWAALALWSLLMVTRPALAWVGLALLPALFANFHPPKAIALVLLALAPTATWWVGNCVKAGGILGLHPVYRADEPGITRPTHGAFWELAKSWGARGDGFHPVMEGAYRAALECDTASVYALPFTLLAPEGSLRPEQYLAVRNAFSAWQRFTCTQLAPALASPAGTIAHTTPEEQRIITELEGITRAWRHEHFWYHHVRVPLRVLKQLVAHSNLNLFLFQSEWRGKPLMEGLRWASAALHVGLFAGLLFALMLRVPASVRWCAAGALFYVAYLCYVQRGVEERYTLPVLYLCVCIAPFAVKALAGTNFATPKTARP